VTPELHRSQAPSWVWLAALFLLGVLSGCSGVPQDNDDDLPPADIELVCDRDYYPLLREMVESAEEHVEVAQWEFFSSPSTNRLIATLNNAVERGVPVRVLLDESIEANHTAIQAFETYGIEAKLDSSSNRRVHTKMVVVDSQTAIIGSTNWSGAALDSNRECNVIVRSGPTPSYFDAWFEQLWDDSGDRSSPDRDAGEEQLALALVNDDLLPQLLERIAAASQSIDFTLYATFLQPSNLSSPAMQVFSALAEAEARGVPVRGVADFTTWSPENNDSNQEAVSWLRDRGVEMRWDDPDANMHAKVFLIDEGTQVQTANISSSGLSQNHEGGVWSKDEGVRQAAQDWFEDLWGESTHIRP